LPSPSALDEACGRYRLMGSKWPITNSTAARRDLPKCLAK
jgi:hypothetical protein